MSETQWASAILQQGCCALMEVAAPWLRLLSALLAMLVVFTIINACMIVVILVRSRAK